MPQELHTKATEKTSIIKSPYQKEGPILSRTRGWFPPRPIVHSPVTQMEALNRRLPSVKEKGSK